MQGQPYTEEAYVKKVKETYPNDYEEVLKLYIYRSGEEIELSAAAQHLWARFLSSTAPGSGLICIEKTATNRYIDISVTANCALL